MWTCDVCWQEFELAPLGKRCVTLLAIALQRGRNGAVGVFSCGERNG